MTFLLVIHKSSRASARRTAASDVRLDTMLVTDAVTDDPADHRTAHHADAGAGTCHSANTGAYRDTPAKAEQHGYNGDINC